MAVHLKDPRIHVEDANGNPYVGAKLYVYDVGTTTLQSIWTDSALSVAASNPLTSDSNGYFALTYLTSGTYKVRIEESDGTLIVEADNQDTGIPLGSGVLAVVNGGTGASTAAGARTNLGVPANSEITTITSDVLARLKKTGGELTGDTNNSGTGFFAIPSGTTAQQTAPTDGTGIRYNTTISELEAYINAVWVEMIALPTGYIDGLTLSNAADTDHDITVAAGAARNVQSSNSDDHNIRLSSAITKQIDANWAVGTNAGGLDGGAVGNSTWYHVFIIHDPTNGITDALFSSSLTSPTLPTNYTKSRRIGSVLTDGSANIIAFTQNGDEFLFGAPITDVNSTNPGTAEQTEALSVPLGVKVDAIVGGRFEWLTTGDASHRIYSPDEDDLTPAGGNQTHQTKASSALIASIGRMRVRTDTSQQIKIRHSASSTNDAVVVNTLGWVDPRGRNE